MVSAYLGNFVPRLARIVVFALVTLWIGGISFANSDVTIKGSLNRAGKYVGTNPKTFTPTRAVSTAAVSVIKSYLNLPRNVIITTASTQLGNGDLIVAAEIAKSGKKPSTLELRAERDLVINKPLRSTRSALSIVLKAGRSMTINSPITTFGGNLVIQGTAPLNPAQAITTGAGTILIQTGSIASSEVRTLTTAGVEVGAQGALRMRGTITGNLSVFGTVAGGSNSAADLTVNGALAMQTGSTLAVNLGATTKFGKIVAKGGIALAGTLKLDCIDGYEDVIVPTHSFTIISGSAVTGTFDGVPNGGRVFLPDDLGSLKVTYGASSVTLSDWQPVIVDLNWDPGTADEGTEVFTNSRQRGRRHYFRVHTEVTDIAAWRTRLTLPATGGTGDLYLRRTTIPSTTSYEYRSIRAGGGNDGADGFVLNENQFSAGQEWYALVYAEPAKAWSIFSGRAYVQDLGALPWTDVDNNGAYQIGEPVQANASGPKLVYGEGMRFYKVAVPAGIPAMSLWLNGSHKMLSVRQFSVPFPADTELFDRKQIGQMLLVPPYLTGEVATYFVSVVGDAGETINLDTRIQEVTDVAFNTNVANVEVPDAPYRVYRVQVPLEQIAWDVSVNPSEGNANVAVRRDTVAAEFDNDGFSEVPGTARDSITLVPSFLTDGTWFITVYGESSYQFSLRNGPPQITPIGFTDSRVNDEPLRVGWKFFALTDIDIQLGSHGWILELANQVSGSEIAMRRNAVPSRWRYRTNGQPTIYNSSEVQYSSFDGFLERPAHQPDVWYVGVYMPTEPLGAFTLNTRPMVPPPIAFDGGTRTVTDLEPGRWTFARITVPPGIEGWDVRIRNVSGPVPSMAIRQDLLPELASNGALGNIPAWTLSKEDSWPTGFQWKGTLDWTGYSKDANGLPSGTGVVAATDAPLKPGTYYVGVINLSESEKTSFTIESRGIGAGQTFPITDLPYAGGQATITNLAPREARYFRTTIPPNTPSWEVVVDATVGDVQLMARWESIADFNAAPTHSIYHMTHMGLETEIRKIGHERYVLLPVDGDYLPEGNVYLSVVSEGVNPIGDTIGTDSSSAVIRSLGPLGITQMGMATNDGIRVPVSLVAGQIKAFQFQVPPGKYGIECRLLDAVGSPVLTVIPGEDLPAPKIPSQYGVYGLDGGLVTTSTTYLLTGSNPPAGTWSALVNAPPTNDATATLEIIVRDRVPVAYDGGVSVVTEHAFGTWRYFDIVVPADAEGWDLRVTGVNGENPPLMIRRGLAPENNSANNPTMIPTGWHPYASTTWAFGNQWWANVNDWTGYSLNPGPVDVPPRIVAGMRRPLEPGAYIAGVFNNTGNDHLAYSVNSRGIGANYTYPVTDLAYAGGTAQITNLAPREARYFRVNVPANSPSWEVTLAPEVGEVELLVRLDAIPDFYAGQDGSIHSESSGSEVKMKKIGPERYVLLPDTNQTSLPEGNYYIAVVSEGVGPAANTAGIGTSNAQLTSVGPLAVKYLGVPTPEGLKEEVQLEPGQILANTITVPESTQSLEVKLENSVGNPQFSLVYGEKLPIPAAYGSNTRYGWNSGIHGVTHNSIMTVANPAPGIWTILVRGGQKSGESFVPSSADLIVTALTTIPVDFDGGNCPIANQPPTTWRYFKVVVPEGVLGWDIRLRSVTGAMPALLVRRDDIPFVNPNSTPGNFPSWNPSASLTWPTGNQWLGTEDWTNYEEPAQSSGPPGLVAAMGRPLEPGTYIVGVFNNKTTPTSYTVRSRGIGVGLTYEVSDLGFAGGSAQVTDLLPREPKYFKLTVPEATRSWELTLGTTVGDLQLAIRRGFVPDFSAGNAGSLYSTVPQLKIRKSGAERYLLLSNATSDIIPAGDYYIAVVSDGVNPDRAANKVGTGPASGVLTSLGTLAVTSLGSVTEAGSVTAVNLISTQVKAYSFDVPNGTHLLEVRLENTVGFPEVTLEPGTRLVAPSSISSYGGVNGGGGGDNTNSIITYVNPQPGPWSLMVRATEAPSGTLDRYPDASATLVVRRKVNAPLNFDPSQNGNGLTHTDERDAINGEHNIYQVTPPSILNAEPVLGWIIRTEILQGNATVRVFKNFASPSSGVERPAGTMVVVPPFLTFDQPWYVQVKAIGATRYRISCRALTLARPAWTMPESHNVTFGDSGTDLNGSPLPGDSGVDLEQNGWHFYAVDVPANNRGLLRTELQAISGDPDLYIREDGVPTLDHGNSGPGALYHRSLDDSTTNYGNWVPVAGRTEKCLRPGRWYFGVRAGNGSNVRYRLLLSTGKVREMALDPSTATAQIPSSVTGEALPDNDWRYYRFTVPENAPSNWSLTFAQNVGDVVMHIRDTVPPGQEKKNVNTSSEILNASTDKKNQGPYDFSYDLPSEYPFTTPPLRPGHTYYVGFRSNNSATFSFSSRIVNGINGNIGIPQALDFYTGSVTTTIPAAGSALYRVVVPDVGTRFKYTATHSNTVSVRIEQGTLPGISGSQHYASTAQNSSANLVLSSTTWPWQPGKTYYVRFVNTSTSPQNIIFNLNGKDPSNEDEDNDGMLDAWEMQWFDTLSQTAAGDADLDGVTNLVEFTDGTIPNDASSAKYALTLLARNGTAAVAPIQAKYARGTVVSLGSTPSGGYNFVGWVGTPFRKDDFAIKATGIVTIPTTGTWTFGAHSGDGVRLLVNGVTVISDLTTHEPRAAFGHLDLAAGSYPIELTAFERSSGESLELFAAPGNFTSIQPQFRLVGDTANGGLAVETTVNQIVEPGFLVRQVAVLSGTIGSMTTADTTLNGSGTNRLETTGTIDSINFLEHEINEGYFTNNAHFPLTSGVEDQPLSLPVYGTYTITALHSLPLGVGTDAEALNWQTGGHVPWLAENDAVAAADAIDVAGSGPIGDAQSSIMQTILQGPGTLTYRWRVSSQSGDNLTVTLDGAGAVSISGDTVWAPRTLNIPSGTHRVTWTYSKNASGSAGNDRGYVDQVTYTPQ